ncbi:MAG: fibronectin type III domain-containing protein [Saprospiraceae bacterium]|nr:fibronectin type III domain-containing protein [Candidatus Defluviibacterium haderslevense]
MSIYSDHNTHYEYKMRAIDSTGNISTFSVIKGGILKATSQNLEIKDFKIRQTKNSNEVELSWNFNPPKELKDKKYKFIISRSTGQDGVKYYQELNSEMNSYKDSKLNNGVLYNYAVSVKYEDGLSSLNRDIKSLLIQ